MLQDRCLYETPRAAAITARCSVLTLHLSHLKPLAAQTGAGLSRSSRKTHPPKRPEGGWSLLVQPLGKAARGAADVAAAQQPFVVAPDGTRRELTEDEKVKLQRQAARPRHKVC